MTKLHALARLAAGNRPHVRLTDAYNTMITPAAAALEEFFFWAWLRYRRWGFSKTDELFIRMRTFAEFIFSDYLSLKTGFSIQNTNIGIDKYNEALVGYTSTGIRAENLDYNQLAPMEANRSNDNYFDYQWQSILNFYKQFDKRHDMSAIAGMQLESTTIKFFL